eukprot:Ihof_evm6s330 gene=Ihof_evmTU6s330
MVTTLYDIFFTQALSTPHAIAIQWCGQWREGSGNESKDGVGYPINDVMVTYEALLDRVKEWANRINDK